MMFPMRYKLKFYVLFKINSAFKVLNSLKQCTLQSIEFGMTFFDIHTIKRHRALEITAQFISVRL
jgi:hypothetical protein